MAEPFVIFRVGDVTCALARPRVTRIAAVAALARPPSAPPMLAGFVNLAGEPLPVVEAADLFQTAPARDVDPLYRHLLVVDGTLALAVDRVADVRPLETDGAMQADEGATLNGCVTHMLGEGAGAISILGADRILLAVERARLDELAAIEKARLAQWAAEP